MTKITFSPAYNIARYFGIVAIVIAMAGSLVTSQAQTKAPYNKQTLLEALRKNAKDHRLTTQDFVAYVQSRGVNFNMTAVDEVELRNAGAPDELIRAIRENYRWAELNETPLPKGKGLLTITTRQSGSAIFVNGKSSGTISDEGVLRLPPLKAGQYKITIRKEHYEPQERSVQIVAGSSTTENFDLVPLKGSLTVIPNLSGAIIYIRGVEYPDAVRNLSVDPGDYEVRVFKKGYQPFARTLTVGPGQPVSLPVTLEVLKVDEMVAQASNSLIRKDYAAVVSISREILNANPEEPRATLLTGLAYYYSDQYSLSSVFLTKALKLGQQVVLPIKHHHAVLLSDDLCVGRISIGQGVLAFNSTDRAGHDFIVPASKIYELTPEPRKFGRVHVRVGIQNKNKEDKKTYNFHVFHSYLVQTSSGGATFVRCDNCNEESALLYQLLKELKDTPAQPSAASSEAGSPPAPKLKVTPKQPD